MRYLVTGGAGFIGSHLVDSLLMNGHDVTVLDDLSSGRREQVDSRARFVQASITDPQVFDALVAEADGVFHLAAIASVERSRREWDYTHAVNLGGMVRLLDAIVRLERALPVVYASSAAVYGDNPALPLGEQTATSPASAYGADKLGCELHARAGALVHGIPSLGLRFFNVYGPRQDPASPYSGVVSIFMQRIPRGQPVTIYGDGRQTRDFIYVGDVVRALSAAMQALAERRVTQGICNVCTGKGTSLLDLIAAIETISGKQAEKTFTAARVGDIKESRGDASRLQEWLGIRAETTPLEQGLATILEHI